MISLRSKIAVKILNYYFLNPDAGHYINELARILEVDPKNLDRKLKELEREGILRSEFSGKQRYFYLAKNSALVKNYRQVFLSTVGLEEQLSSVLKKISGVKKAYIFGSYAKDKLGAASDIDILVIGHHSILDLQKEINRIQRYSGREINTVNMGEDEFNQKRKNNNQFLKQIFSGKTIKLI